MSTDRDPPRTSEMGEERARLTSRFRGCLLGGAVGDALGAAVEFLTLDEIRSAFGSEGITDLAPMYGRVGAITDDTQMTLFTAEGLLRARSRWEGNGICHAPSVIQGAYHRWLHTQGERSAAYGREGYDGWLVAIPALHARRAPGRTCVSALRGERQGSVLEPLNQSKGCGGVMRVAPVGLVGAEVFDLGCEAAALTHGHPTGYLAAGAFALMIRQLLLGEGVEHAVGVALERLRKHDGHEETTAALSLALELARGGEPSAEMVEKLGAGWVAEEALAIAVYSSLVAGEDFAAGVRLAVNHSGDSDSTGAIAGNLLGTRLGVEAIPSLWLDQLELREEITVLADDLVTGYREDEAWWERYPGW